MEFSWQEYWNGLPFPSPEDLPDPEIEPGSPTLQADALPSDPPGKPSYTSKQCSKFSKSGCKTMRTMNFQMLKLVLEKAEEPGTKLLTSVGSLKKAREFQKNICFIDYTKAFDCVDHSKLLEILQQMGIPDHLTCLLKNFYADQEATVITAQETIDWFQMGKGVHQGYILSP